MTDTDRIEMHGEGRERGDAVVFMRSMIKISLAELFRLTPSGRGTEVRYQPLTRLSSVIVQEPGLGGEQHGRPYATDRSLAVRRLP